MTNLPPLRAHLLAATAIAAFSLAGCEVGPDFHAPHAAVPAGYIQDQPAGEATPFTSGDSVDPSWWTSFNDPTLTKLESVAVTQNLDLQMATERLLEAEAQAEISGANLYPSLGFAASFSREGPSKEGIFTALGGSSSAGAANNAATVANGSPAAIGGGGAPGAQISPLDLYQYGLQSMYDLDLWGKNRRAVESAIAAARASEEARRASLLNVEAQVASHYIALRGTETVLTITDQNLKSARQLVDLTVERQQAGLTTSLDVANARATAAQIASQVPGLIAERDSNIDQLGLLLGITPQSLPTDLTTPAAVPLAPPNVPIGLPSDLLRRRPDVREAEQSLHEATAETGVAVASFFPDISLSGSVSLQALQFKNLNEFKAITYAVGPEIQLPIFEGGQLRGQLKLRQAQQQEAALSYAQTVLTAFYQVDTALVAYNQEHATVDQFAIDTAQSQIALGLAEDQYKQGLADYLSVLDAQQSYLSAQQNQAQAIAQTSTDLVTLYQALGGGWEQTYPDPTMTTQTTSAAPTTSPGPLLAIDSALSGAALPATPTAPDQSSVPVSVPETAPPVLPTPPVAPLTPAVDPGSLQR